MTRAAFENAMVCVIATGGSTNAVLHLIAMAHSVGIPLTLDDFQRVSDRIPFISDLKPSGRCAPTHQRTHSPRPETAPAAVTVPAACPVAPADKPPVPLHTAPEWKRHAAWDAISTPFTHPIVPLPRPHFPCFSLRNGCCSHRGGRLQRGRPSLPRLPQCIRTVRTQVFAPRCAWREACTTPVMELGTAQRHRSQIAPRPRA